MNYWNFEKLITKNAMTLIYIIGVFLLTVGGLAMLLVGLTTHYSNSITADYLFYLMVFGVLVMTLGNLFWRIFCEIIIILFRINENLEVINQSLNKNNP